MGRKICDDAIWYSHIIRNLIRREWGDRIVPILNEKGIKFIKYDYENIKQINGKKLLSLSDTNKYIANKIIQGEPCMIGRFGGSELSMMVSVLRETKYPYIDRRKYYLDKMCLGAGFFPNDIKQAEKFVDLMFDCCKDLDLCGVWKLFMEDYIIKQYANQAQITKLHWLEPWNMRLEKQSMQLPWTFALKGKKVLVIHPFAESIKKQYNYNREHIFERIYPAEEILPSFELETIKAIQSIGGNNEYGFATWFDALESMKEQCSKCDFDVAIIGCGAYGFPLAAEIKRMGKCAVHLGGATQLLWGITGRRWIQGNYHNFSNDVVNNYWVRPMDCEKPINAEEVEGGCYW